MAHSKDAHGKHNAMAEFNKDHHTKHVPPIDVNGEKYASEMGACEELRDQVDKLAQYTKKHKMKY